MMIDVLRSRLCTWQSKWAERLPKVMKQSQRWNTLEICPCRDLNSGGSDLWSNALPIRPRRRPADISENTDVKSELLKRVWHLTNASRHSNPQPARFQSKVSTTTLWEFPHSFGKTKIYSNIKITLMRKVPLWIKQNANKF